MFQATANMLSLSAIQSLYTEPSTSPDTDGPRYGREHVLVAQKAQVDRVGLDHVGAMEAGLLLLDHPLRKGVTTLEDGDVEVVRVLEGVRQLSADVDRGGRVKAELAALRLGELDELLRARLAAEALDLSQHLVERRLRLRHPSPHRTPVTETTATAIAARSPAI